MRVRRPHLRDTIRAHLVALVVAQIALVAATIWLGAREEFRDAETDARHEAARMARYAVDFIVEEREESIEDFAELPSVMPSLGTAELCQLSESSRADESLRWFRSTVHMLKPDGSALCPQDAGQVNVRGESWFVDALRADEPVSAGRLTDPITKKDALIDAIAVPEMMVLVYSTELDSIGPTLDHEFGHGRTPARFVITSEDRSIEVASSGGKTGRPTAGTPFATPLTTHTFDDLDGAERIYAELSVPGEGWHLYAGISTDDAFHAARESLRERILLGIVVATLFLAGALVLARRLERPVRSLVGVTRRVTEGDRRARVVPRGPAELRELGQSFNHMTELTARAQTTVEAAFQAQQRVADELREVDEMRNAFLMAISHELRTPLTAVVGFASVLQDDLGLTAEERLESIDAIAKQSNRLEKLLLDLLDIERLARGVIEPNRRDVDVRDIVDGVIDRSNAKRRIHSRLRSSVRAFVDPALVERILENLVSNAIKHTPSTAQIWVCASRRSGQLHLSVADDGDGVAPELKDAIFEPFKQGVVPDHSPGTGVGLTLVAQFAKLHGGRAWVEDRRGGGAVFRVELPAKRPSDNEDELAA